MYEKNKMQYNSSVCSNVNTVLFGVVRIRTSSDKIYLAVILLTHNFAKTKTTKLYESKNIIQGIADEASVYGLKDIDMNNIVIIRYTFPS